MYRLQRFEKTNEMLTNCNALSVNRLASAGSEFKKHTQLLVDMKKDLNQIFRRINVLKSRLSNQYPQAFAGRFFVCMTFVHSTYVSPVSVTKHVFFYCSCAKTCVNIAG